MSKLHVMQCLNPNHLLPLRALGNSNFTIPSKHFFRRPQSNYITSRSNFFPTQKRRFTSSSNSERQPPSHSRGPASSEDTQTDFASLDVLSSLQAPATAINSCVEDGFYLGNGLRIGDGSGCLLVAGEAFWWRPWEAGKRNGVGETQRAMLNGLGQWEVRREAWGLLELVWPKPDLLILGLGPSMHPLSLETKRYINSLGIRIEVQDTRNAAAQFNLLATERGVGDVAAALIPIGWQEAQR